MASVHKRPNSPFWWGRYPVGNGKWVFRSTKLKERKKALELVQKYHDTARMNVTMLQAQHQIQEIYSNLNLGEKLPSDSIGGFLDKWVQRKKAEVSPSTLDAYLTTFDQFKRFLGPRAGLDIKLLTRQDVANFRQDRMDKVSPSTARQGIKKLNVALNEARREGLVLANVGEGLTRVRRDTEAVETREFTPEELRKLDQVIQDPEWRGMFLFGLYTGLRLKDVAKAEWDKVEWKEGLINLWIHKRNHWKRKILAPPLLEHLKLMKKTAKGNAIFPKAFRYVERKDRSNVLSNQFKVFLVKAGILEKSEISHKSKGKGRSARRTRSGVGFHSFRHGVTGILKRAGVSQAVAMEIVGHDSKAVSQQYTHISEDHIRQSLANLTNVLGKPAKKGKK